MDLVYSLFVYAFTAVLLSFLVSKLLSLDVSSSKADSGKESCVGEGSLEKKLKVEGSKSLKKRRKKVSCVTGVVSEFKGETEPTVADQSLAGLVKVDDDRKELAFSERNLEFVAEACSDADQLLSAGEVGDKGMISSSEITLDEKLKEVGCSGEGFEQEITSGNDLEKLGVVDQRNDCKEDVVVGEELGKCDINAKEEAGSVGYGDQELENDLLSSERREVFEQDEGRERSEPQINDSVDVGLLGDETVVDDHHHEHQEILESLETESNDQVDDQNVEVMSSVSKEDVVNIDAERSVAENADDSQCTHDGYVDQVDDQNEERSIGDDEGKGEMEISDGEEWEGIERNELERDFAKAMNFVECGDKDGQLGKLGSDVIMQFYGLQKVSMEGPCHEPPPMALKLSARAKWNAWKKLGSMIPEEAMEKYINLLAEKVPGWMGEHPIVEEDKVSSLDANISTTLTLTCIDESKPGDDLVMTTGDLTGNSSSVSKDEE